MRQLFSSITQSLRLPAVCALCKTYFKGAQAVCETCISSFKTTTPACQYCAYPLPDAHFLSCGQCSKARPFFDRAFISYQFVEPLRSLIHQFKYHEGLYLSTLMSRLILNGLDGNDLKPDCLIPVPMHARRIKQRGFNQAAVLTGVLARQLKINYELKHCEKTINTPAQASLDYQQRRKNLNKAFKVNASPYKHVAIIDDLLTTGSTANALAYQLKKTGVERVDVWCCARAVMD